MKTRSRSEKPFQPPGGRLLRAASVTVALGMLLVGCVSSPDVTAAPESTRSSPPSPMPSATIAAPAPAPAREPLARGEAPASVRIPAIGIDAPLIDLGIASSGQMEAPEDYDEIGWFTGGGRPGGFGPTVIAGHVDSPTGPAVFLHLSELAEGDIVEVTDVSGNPFSYVVTEVADYPKSAFPTAAVFGAVAADELRLITCGGVFDPEAASYVDNRVVYAVRTAV